MATALVNDEVDPDPFTMNPDKKSEISGDKSQLHLQNRELTRELLEIHDRQSVIIKALLRCQGLLSQFRLGVVREAFVKGELIQRYPFDKVLQSFDQIMRIVLPEPTSNVGAKCETMAVQFISGLLSKDSSEPCDCNGQPLAHRQSFAAWKELMAEIQHSPWWKLSPAENLQQRERTTKKTWADYGRTSSDEETVRRNFRGDMRGSLSSRSKQDSYQPLSLKKKSCVDGSKVRAEIRRQMSDTEFSDASESGSSSDEVSEPLETKRRNRADDSLVTMLKNLVSKRSSSTSCF